MIYLSLLELNARDPDARRLAGSLYAVHQRLLHAWEDGTFQASGESQPRMLFRVETESHPPRVLVQAPFQANWERCFPGSRGLAAPPRQKSVGEALRRLQPGQALQFRLRANPTRREPGRNVADPKTGKTRDGSRVSVANAGPRRDAARQLLEQELGFPPSGSEINSYLFEQWLRTQLEKAGATCLEVTSTDEGLIVERRRGLKLQSVLFEGCLRVEDPDRLRASVQAGIGSGRGFGFGLLSLAPAR